MAESLCCPPATIPILLTSYTPKENKKFKLKKKKENTIFETRAWDSLDDEKFKHSYEKLWLNTLFQLSFSHGCLFVSLSLALLTHLI